MVRERPDFGELATFAGGDVTVASTGRSSGELWERGDIVLQAEGECADDLPSGLLECCSAWVKLVTFRSGLVLP
jgi:hypothetical protein